MREVKFRAWHPIAKDMVFFGLGEDNLRAYNMEEEMVYTMDLSDGYEVMQFTGLHDKNGVEIYEGDILAHEEKGINPYYSNCFFVMKWEDRTTKSHCRAGWSQYGPPCNFEVIGNIHQHPNLLDKS